MGFKHLNFISFSNYYHKKTSIQGLGSCEWLTQSCCWLVQWPKSISHYKFQVVLPQKKEKNMFFLLYLVEVMVDIVFPGKNNHTLNSASVIWQKFLL